MTYALVAAGVVLAAVIAWLVWRRVRTTAAPVVRDAPTAPADALGRGLAGTRAVLGGRLSRMAGDGGTGPDWDALEEALLAADVGVAATADIVAGVAASGEADLRAAVRRRLLEVFAGADRSLRLEGSPAVVVVVGVNGSGKTTTVAKLGARLERAGHRVMLGAADTFRAAASE
ncbi:MAG TPA: signal recognition particle receptor subunit alpha, partial [Thermoanaerobaculia bacterium]|nr:signal recognition particle receptor subunit alpha [Thermoanaerobaculia bacterium]